MVTSLASHRPSLQVRKPNASNGDVTNRNAEVRMRNVATCGAWRATTSSEGTKNEVTSPNHSLLLSLSIMIVIIGPTQDEYNVVMAIEIELESWIV